MPKPNTSNLVKFVASFFNLLGSRLFEHKYCINIACAVNAADHEIAITTRNARKQHATNNLLVYLVQTLP